MIQRNHNPSKISELLNNIIISDRHESITFEEILNKLSSKGFGLLIMVFALPNIIPLPGLSTITGIPIIFFSIQLLLGNKSPWLPNFIKKKSIKFELIKKMISKIIPYFQKIEYLFKPRIGFFLTRFGRSLIGFSILISSIVLSLPIIFANAIPTFSIILLAIGLITKDGLAILCGIIIGLFGVTIAMSVALMGFEAIKFVFSSFL